MYDRTNIRGVRLDSAGITRIMSRIHHDLQETIRKYCTGVKNQLRISDYAESGTNKNEFVTIPDNRHECRMFSQER